MGLELLDFGFQLEKKHHRRPDWPELWKFGVTDTAKKPNQQWDIRVDALREYINTHADLICPCKYILRGMPQEGACPKCGKHFADSF